MLFFGSKISTSFQIGYEYEHSLYLYVRYCVKWFALYPILISMAILLQEFVFNTFLKSCFQKNATQNKQVQIGLTKHLSPNLRRALAKKGSQKIIIQCIISFVKALLNYPITLFLANFFTSIQFKLQLFLFTFVIEMLGSCYYLLFKNFLASALFKISLFLFYRGMINFCTNFSFSFQILYLIILLVLLLYFEKYLPINKEYKNKIDIYGEIEREKEKEIKKEKGTEIEIEREKEHFFEKVKNKEFDKLETENYMEKETNQIITFKKQKKQFKQKIKREFLIMTLFVLILLIITITLFLVLITTSKKQDFSKNDYCDSKSFLSVENNVKMFSIGKCVGDVEIEKREYKSKDKYLVLDRVRNELKYRIPKTKKENIVIYFKCIGYFGELVQVYPVAPNIKRGYSTKHSKIENGLTGQRRPNIVLLFLSRASRLSFEKDLPKTQKAIFDLKSQNLIKDWKFKGYRTASRSVEENQQMVFSGQHKNINHNHEKWVWNYYNKNYGYYTSIIDQKCSLNNSFPFNLKTPISDLKFLDQKLFTPFCDGCWLQPKKNIPKLKNARCLYGEYGNRHVFNYIQQNFEKQFLANNSKFILALFYESFDENQSLLQTLDLSFSQFMSEFASEKKYNNTILLLVSEEGFNHGVGSYKLHKYPLFQIIIPTHLLPFLNGMEKDLDKNIHKNFINRDVYHTLLHLGNYPESIHDAAAEPSLLNKIPKRSCEELHFDASFCHAWEKN
ncbi:hypothetical protein M0812_19011 [Anaeramoeba flamelloides]|uniref:Transmembrane protein n=1 Tax=Anaeramoeba flamelloides TaxID=1746091 RepID=A0AAV7ZB69_9EUKA|nr:hypothetical protein M0812_19011 [Anaeramoeba flamelloides]